MHYLFPNGVSTNHGLFYHRIRHRDHSVYTVNFKSHGTFTTLDQQKVDIGLQCSWRVLGVAVITFEGGFCLFQFCFLRQKAGASQLERIQYESGEGGTSLQLQQQRGKQDENSKQQHREREKRGKSV